MITRRATLAAAAATMAASPAPGPAWQFTMPAIEGGALEFAAFRGRVLLVVNTASFCAFTPQYKVLEATYRALQPRGLTVIGVPSGDFGQEKDSDASVKTFCELTYGVEFPMSAIAHVRGKEAAPFYRWVAAQTRWEPRWNFFKVLIGRDGAIAGTFGAEDEPDKGRLKAAIEKALATSS